MDKTAATDACQRCCENLIEESDLAVETRRHLEHCPACAGSTSALSGSCTSSQSFFAHCQPESIFDFVQGITRLARDKTQQDARLDMEGRAKKLLDRVG